MIDTEMRSGPKIKGTESCAESEIVFAVSQGSKASLATDHLIWSLAHRNSIRIPDFLGNLQEIDQTRQDKIPFKENHLRPRS